MAFPKRTFYWINTNLRGPEVVGLFVEPPPAWGICCQSIKIWASLSRVSYNLLATLLYYTQIYPSPLAIIFNLPSRRHPKSFKYEVPNPVLTRHCWPCIRDPSSQPRGARWLHQLCHQFGERGSLQWVWEPSCVPGAAAFCTMYAEWTWATWFRLFCYHWVSNAFGRLRK